MSIYTEKAQNLRDDTNTHYNCAQAVLMAFSEKAGVSEEVAAKISSNFGAGMKNGGVCGAITGGLMALGLFGITDAAEYYKRVEQAIDNEFNCAGLLAENAKSGGDKKKFCDGLIAACVTIVESMLLEANKL